MVFVVNDVTRTFSAAQSVSTIELAASQSTLSSYLPQSGISMLNDVPSCHIHQIYELNDCELFFLIVVTDFIASGLFCSDTNSVRESVYRENA